MIIVDRALRRAETDGEPVRVAMVGAGFMGRGIANQIVGSVPGMRLVAICNRRPDTARRAYAEAGREDVAAVGSVGQLEDCIARGQPAVTGDPEVVCRAPSVDVLVEVTGSVEFAAGVVLDAIDHGVHVVLMNAELDGTLGPLLRRRAERAGVVYSACDGDQPGVQMNLVRFVRSIGLTPLVCGNIKGLHDPYRNPTTQADFARRWGQNPRMVTSFADGTKISFEQAIVANATGMRVARRGMLGRDFRGHIDEATSLYDVDELRERGGVVDYVVGADPSPGVYVFATHDDPRQRHYLKLYKLGEGPLYSFYTPYHLCHFEVPLSVARVALFEDPVLQPLGAPRVEVVAAAKTDLAGGTTLDGLGEYTVYGLCENAEVVHRDRLLPIGLAEGCVLRRDVGRDEVLTYDDVERPAGRLAHKLRQEQDEMFMGSSPMSQGGRA